MSRRGLFAQIECAKMAERISSGRASRLAEAASAAAAFLVATMLMSGFFALAWLFLAAG